MNQVQIAEFCRLLRDYVMEQRASHATHHFGMALGFRMCYGMQDDCDLYVYERMVKLTEAAITARYELRLV